MAISIVKLFDKSHTIFEHSVFSFNQVIRWQASFAFTNCHTATTSMKPHTNGVRCFDAVI